MKRIGYIYAPRVWGNLYLGPGHWLAAPAGIIGAFNTSGNVFFVDWFNGDDGYDGSLPELDAGSVHGPFKTIAHALGECVNDHDDYIIVLDAWLEETPIVIEKSRVHIIGLSSNPARPYPEMRGVGDNAIFRILASGDNCEIAGLGLGGGATHASIEQTGGGVYGAYIHHNVFGHGASVSAPLHGIYVEGDLVCSRIENNKFLGENAHAGGLITGNGIQMAFGLNSNTEIVDNVFQGLLIAMNLTSNNIDGLLVERNKIALAAIAQGNGITLGAGAEGCLLVGNKAGFGGNSGAFVVGTIPYLDNNLGNNHWVENYVGNSLSDPE